MEGARRKRKRNGAREDAEEREGGALARNTKKSRSGERRREAKLTERMQREDGEEARGSVTEQDQCTPWTLRIPPRPSLLLHLIHRDIPSVASVQPLQQKHDGTSWSWSVEREEEKEDRDERET